MATYKYTNSGTASLKVTDRPIYGSKRIGSYTKPAEIAWFPIPTNYVNYVEPMSEYLLHYELNDHLGNVTAVVTGRLLPGANAGSLYQPELNSAQGYEAGGSLLPGRNYSSSSYNYGFNGKPKDDEIYGSTGTSYDFGARLYDPRVGRWLSLDPMAKRYASLSPYHFAGNNPIFYIDPNGKEILPWATQYTLLGHSWWSYPKFSSNDEGGRFSATFISLFTSNKAFETVSTQLFASTLVYEVKQGTGASNARGEFMGSNYGYKGSKGSPFVIAFNSPTDGESTVFEEFFHAGQHDYYGERAAGFTGLQIEVEAKAAKALSGIMGNSPSEQAFFKNPAVQQYATQVGAGKQIDLKTSAGFRHALTTLAAGVFEEYGGNTNSGPWSGSEKDALKNYDPYTSTEYLEHIFNPKEGVEVVKGKDD